MSVFFLRWVVSAAALFLTASVVKGIYLNSLGSALVAAALLGIINSIIRPIINFFTWPLNFLTLGVFPFLLNGVFLFFVGNIVKGFTVEGFLPALLGALILGFITSLLNLFVR